MTDNFKRYVVVGLSVYLFELALILLAQRLGASNVLSVGISYWAGMVASFLFQKIFTFGDKRKHHKVIIPQIIAFIGLLIFNFSFTILFTKLLDGVVPTVITRTLALGITTIWNFYLYKTRIFKHSNEIIIT